MKTKSLKKVNISSLNMIVAPLGLIGLVLIFAVSSPYFFTFENVLNITRQASINIIIAIGMTIVILTSGIDLSVGSIVGLSACVVAQLTQVIGMNLWVAVVIGILVGTLLGLINGLIISFGKIPPFIATLGMMGMARGGALIITSGYPSSTFDESFRWIGNGDIYGIPIMFLIAIAVLLIGLWILKFTTIGRNFFAIGGSEEAAKYSGINTNRVKVVAYTISGICCGIASIVMASRINSAPPAAGAGYELNAIAAVVIGGASLAGGEGSMLGTLLGAFIMAVLTNGLNLLNVNPSIQTALIGAVIILMVYIKNIGNK
jgi:ribose transport system permease protein